MRNIAIGLMLRVDFEGNRPSLDYISRERDRAVISEDRGKRKGDRESQFVCRSDRDKGEICVLRTRCDFTYSPRRHSWRWPSALRTWAPAW